MISIVLTKKETQSIAKSMKAGVSSRKEMVVFFVANPDIAKFIIDPSEKDKDLNRFEWLAKGDLEIFQKSFPDSFDGEKPVFGRADGKKRTKTDLGLAMLNLVNWAKSSLPKEEKEEKPKSIDDFAVMLLNAVKFAEKHSLPMDQVKAQIESLAKSIK